jgi:hypothetical protein
LYRGDEVALAAESVSGEQFEQTISQLLGTCITGFQHPTTEGRLHVRLGQQWRLVVDLTNQWQTENDILEIAIPDGRLFTIDRRGELLAAPSLDAERARNWSRCRRRNWLWTPALEQALPGVQPENIERYPGAIASVIRTARTLVEEVMDALTAYFAAQGAAIEREGPH